MLRSINPATGEHLASLPRHEPGEVEVALSAAAAAQARWARLPLADRLPLLTQMAAELRAGRDDHARLISLEMGKPVAEARAEIEKCAWTCDHYAAQAETYLAPDHVQTQARASYVRYDPLGVVLAIMPWNYPFWQVFRFLVPALASGNGAILKHASNVPQCARAIGQIMDRAAQKAGAPAGLFATLLVGADAVEGLIADRRIAAVTLTGSTDVGRIVAAQAGRNIKKQVLELGGSDPFIVLADADLERAAEVAVKARFHNAGQSCISPKRFIVEAAVADRFVEAVVARTDAIRVGDPFDPEILMGPMAQARLRGEVHGIVEATITAGATLLRGGKVPPGAGAFYPPTILDGVAAGMPSFVQETFGPVVNIVRAKDAEQAIALANDTDFGLSAAIWTADPARGQRLAAELQVGAVFVNSMVASDPRLPFGGIRQSGYGRELGAHGIREFCNAKTVWVA